MTRKDGKPSRNIPIEVELHKELKMIASANSIALYELAERLIKERLEEIKRK